MTLCEIAQDPPTLLLRHERMSFILGHRYPSEEVSLTIPPAEDGGSFVTTTTVESILHLANPVTTTPVESASWSLGFVSLGTARVGTSIASTSGSTYNALDGAALFTSIILILSLSLMLH
ncbi:hypothetical protein TcWFU_010186 [Taenia crassiceps]|uniref:Uncharacterized protein n=1 Tax=Taenia crassiceps TaxID=6207 RepID=A0ABR4Q4E7_9CEST